MPVLAIHQSLSVSRRVHVSSLAIGLVAMTLFSIASAGCSVFEHSGSDAPRDPIADVKDKDRQLNQREIALEEIKRQVADGSIDAKAARATMKDLIWKGSAPSPLRQQALGVLLSDTSPEAMEDTRNLLRLRLPTEGAWPMVVEISKAIQTRASDPAWRGQTASLIRSYARKVPEPSDAERPERAALLALYPGKSIEEIAFDAFVNPVGSGAPERPSDYVAKTSQAAWELLSRLDPDGQTRNTLIAARGSVGGGASTGGANEPALKEIARASKDLGVVPVTGSELAWLRRALDDKDARNATWWAASFAAVQQLSPSQRAGLQLRHIEGVRWASVHRPEWIRSERSELISELGARLNGRRTYHKTEGVGPGRERSAETLKDWEDQLLWGDVLAILVVDEAIKQPSVVAELFKQAAMDRADESTEYGGLLWSRDQWGQTSTKSASEAAGEPFVARGYQPRPAQRLNDRTFIAPEEMFSDSARALAHYHFHVQTPSNAEYAGPGSGDLEYAQTHGRTCVVVTSVGENAMDVDIYFRKDIVIDLGEIVRAR